LEGNA
jgi:hypothetical protein